MEHEGGGGFDPKSQDRAVVYWSNLREKIESRPLPTA